MNNFAELGMRPRTLEILERLGMVQPTEVQCGAIPPLLAARDCIMQSPTGSGKTLAYLLPMVESLRGHRKDGARGLIIGPTRELVTQIGQVLRQLDPGLRQALVYGGVGYQKQIIDLRSADVIIGCPGRLLDLVGRGSAQLGAVQYLVLDEADEMLDAGFAKDVESLVDRTRAANSELPRQTVLASATMPEWVVKMSAKHMKDPELVTVKPAGSADDLEHGLVSVSRDEKVRLLSDLLRHSASTIVFHRTKHGAKKLALQLTSLGHRTAELQGNLSQAAREQAIASFRNRQSSVLVATNVAARGIDVADVALVVNYELPDTAEWMVHRVGRTARNGAKGRALTFISEEDSERWGKLRRSGAPALRYVDSEQLLSSGQMLFLESGDPRPQGRPTGRPRQGGQPVGSGAISRGQQRRYRPSRSGGWRRPEQGASPRHP